jgi:hypothetical protein
VESHSEGLNEVGSAMQEYEDSRSISLNAYIYEKNLNKPIVDSVFNVAALRLPENI